VKERGGYNIMKKPFSRVIKSIVTLENGSKIIKWWSGGCSNGCTS